MATWAPAKKDALEALAAEILHSYRRGRTIVAVDGVDGAGMTRFADDLAVAIRDAGADVFRASLDSFHRPRALSYARGRDSAEGYYRDSFDYSVLRRVLLEPFRLAGSAAFVTAAFDVARDAAVAPRWITGPADAMLVIDGVFLHRPELRGLWNYSIWLDVPTDVAVARLEERDGASDPTTRYTGGQALYLAEADPRAAADAIIDNSDPDHPRRVFEDSC